MSHKENYSESGEQQTTLEQFRAEGCGDYAYIARVYPAQIREFFPGYEGEIDGDYGFALFAADGSGIGFASTRELCAEIAEDEDLPIILVH